MDELTEQVNLALDRVKAEHGFTSESQLADHLGVRRNAVYLWRKGKLSKAFRTIIPLTVLANTPMPHGWAELSKDVRILAPLLAMPKIDA
jgi:DNA-binding XRE family transcriptional regulator